MLEAAISQKQSFTITFDARNIHAQKLLDALRVIKEVTIEDCPYNLSYVNMVREAEKGQSHRISRADLWK